MEIKIIVNQNPHTLKQLCSELYSSKNGHRRSHAHRLSSKNPQFLALGLITVLCVFWHRCERWVCFSWLSRWCRNTDEPNNFIHVGQKSVLKTDLRKHELKIFSFWSFYWFQINLFLPTSNSTAESVNPKFSLPHALAWPSLKKLPIMPPALTSSLANPQKVTQ